MNYTEYRKEVYKTALKLVECRINSAFSRKYFHEVAGWKRGNYPILNSL